MDNFYRLFLLYYIEFLKCKRTTFRSVVRADVPVVFKVIYYYERCISWLTRRLLKNKYGSALFHETSFFLDNMELFESSYRYLGDDASRDRYAEYIAFKSVNSAGIRLNTHGRNIEADLVRVNKCKIADSYIDGFSNIGALNIYDLSSLGYDAKLINDPVGTAIDFVYEQYAYKDLVRPEKGDVVIDCGGAIGDTCVYFCARGAAEIHVFEFIESNIELIRKQAELNPGLGDKLKIVDKPVWETSDVELSYLDKGNSSRVAAAGVYPNTVKTFSIDDMVLQGEVRNVDFIKMDIEGGELPALRGAQETIKKYKPKLAICVYHKNEDLIEIPNYIKSLNPEYELYFDYYTDIGWEAVLYAIDRGKA